MSYPRQLARIALALVWALGALSARSADYPTPREASANDVLYQWDSSRDYNPSPGLEKAKATVLSINAADDERNPPEPGAFGRLVLRAGNPAG